MTTIVSIQSTVAYGHVGNSAATFPLMRRGVTVWPVITVHFSNHTGYGQWRGPLLAPDDVRDVVRGIDERGVLGQADGLLSGYQGAEQMGAAILDSFELIKQRNPRALYCCDPVMGDRDSGCFVKPGIPEFIRDSVVPATDIVTPNQYELEFLNGGTLDAPELQNTAELMAAVRALQERGPRIVLVTSVNVGDLPGRGADDVSMVAVGEDGAYAISTPRIDRVFSGSGDITAAIFFSEVLAGAPLDEALATTAGAVYGVLNRTAQLDQRELALVDAQDELAAPSHHFEVHQIQE